MIRLKVTPVVGLPQFTGWSQVAESTSSASTRLISVFAISGKHAGNVGRDVSDKISDFYYYDIEQLHEFVLDLVEFVKENDCELFISCALISGNSSVFVTRGGSVFLKRKEKIGKILFSQDQIKIVKGSYTNDDVFVLTTLQASQFLNEIEQKFSQGFDVDIIITSVVPGLHAQTDSSLSAIVFINQFLEGEENDEISTSKESLFERHKKIVEVKDEPSLEASIEIDDADDLDDQVGDLKISADLPKIFVNNLSKLKPLVEKLKSLAKVGIFMQLIFKKIIETIKKIRSLKRKKLVFVVAFVLVLLVLILSYAISNRKEAEKINSLMIPIQERLDLAQQQLNTDPISSREIVQEAISSLEKLHKENLKSSAVKLIDEKIIQTSNFYNEISGKKEISELDVFYDLRLVKSDYIANGIDANGNKLVLLDSEKKQVVLLDIPTKKVEVKDFSSYEYARDLAVNENEVFVLSDGLKSFNLTQGSEIKSIRELGDSNRDATFISAYDRFVYVISPEKREIYRYSKGEDGYSDPIGWMQSATGLKYSEITSFSIDGDIWLSTIDGQIKKFSSGREVSFNTRGLNEEFSSSVKIFTNINQMNIYVLEADKNRIVIFSKDGEFKREIKSVSLSTVGAIVASEVQNKIFAVSGSIIFEIPITL
ncbi:MAG: hypothetical protein COZ34_00560 [Candidatus Pacebacteria bacterium CG_4_10_14_3_um_filter_34_15]|nr:hypothetical protein [Candidatus Pacearchaeota archaeon]NCQ65593.1 hypothetical protein [Candidatus Paceibacterota bacterium]OIO43822.1 MAG: hypothetical protein AUJ41_04220 [Candidatus Pacebacteria bacterium CG1_02_43_31]PIQ80738.1 MAG: hypothetical protein COV78_04060 [Candidatus Pacebacteria bacterium CG11_big_fil_rev_8_21_14_0_20_34_55]PIX81961.1 MAG: hypothetical protein COZ34_00560 [Candidatus Pacebacteria bacterium CG_4_10_14_3_um_filter_34_15]PJC43424.1 MAG: hypothetical protein CO0